MDSGEARTAVLFDGSLIRYRVEGSDIAQRPLGNLRRVLDVNLAADVFTSYEPYALLDFGDSLWVVPAQVPLPTRSEWADHLRAVGGYFMATLEGTPRMYQAGGFLGMFRKVAPLVLKGTPLPEDWPSWRVEGPVDPVTREPPVPAAVQGPRR